MVFIVGEAFVNLRSGQLRKAVCPQRVNSLAILKQADDVVHGNPGALYYGVPTPHTRRTDYVTVGFRNRVHTGMVRFPSWGVNRSAAGDLAQTGGKLAGARKVLGLYRKRSGAQRPRVPEKSSPDRSRYSPMEISGRTRWSPQHRAKRDVFGEQFSRRSVRTN